MFTGYQLTKESRDKILKRFPGRYENVVCHHITEKFGVKASEPAPAMPESIKVVGYVDSKDGVEGLLVEVNGSSKRGDGRDYHITLSLQEGRKPVETNNYTVDAKKIDDPIELTVTPKNFATRG